MKRFKDILCVSVPGFEPEPALERAVVLASNNQARLTVASVVESLPSGIELPAQAPSLDTLQAAILQERQHWLEMLISPSRKQIDVQAKVLAGTAFLEIIREVLRNQRDLVIKTPESSGLLDRIFGSDDMHLLRKCPCPVWLTKPGPTKSYRRIVAAVDVDPAYPPEELKVRQALNRQILEIASSLALSEFAELHVAHVWEAISESVMRSAFVALPENEIVAYAEEERQRHQQGLDALMRELSSEVGRDTFEYLKPQTHLIRGLVRKEIPALAKYVGADLVVMGTVARTGIPGFIMGNTAEAILNQIDCSVLAVKPTGFVTPVTLPK